MKEKKSISILNAKPEVLESIKNKPVLNPTLVRQHIEDKKNFYEMLSKGVDADTAAKECNIVFASGYVQV